MSEERDWSKLSPRELAEVTAAQGYSAARILKRIEGFVLFIAFAAAAMLGRAMGWF